MQQQRRYARGTPRFGGYATQYVRGGGGGGPRGNMGGGGSRPPMNMPVDGYGYSGYGGRAQQQQQFDYGMQRMAAYPPRQLVDNNNSNFRQQQMPPNHRARAVSDSVDGAGGPRNPRGGEFRQGGPGRVRPLARLLARSRNSRGKGPLRRGEAEAYKMEVNEIFLEKDQNEGAGAKKGGGEPKGPIPCVTVLDFKRIVPEGVSQRRVCIPVALADSVVRYLNRCRITPPVAPKKKRTPRKDKAPKEEPTEADGVEKSADSSPAAVEEKEEVPQPEEEEITEEETHKDVDPEGTVPTLRASASGPRYDVSTLKPHVFKCPKTGTVIEIEDVEGADGVVEKHLRSYMRVGEKSKYSEGDPMEKIELRNDLMRSLDRFLTDVATRYRNIKGEVTIASLYSYSGERRFYFDLRRTRWGLRLHVSQVTDMHRNVIGIPLEALVSFRTRLNQAITALRLDEESGASGQPKGKAGVTGKARRRKNTGGKRGVPGSRQRSKTNDDTAEGGETTKEGAPEAAGDGPDIKAEPVVSNEGGAAPVEA